MAEFLDSVWMNIFASVLLVGVAALNLWVSQRLMNRTFDAGRRGVWFGLGLLLAVTGTMLIILSLVAIWADCPVDVCL